MSILLPAVEFETGPHPTHAIIWMHGLGADGHDFVPVMHQLQLPPSLSVRFVFPHAPCRPVSINHGFVMPAWYDITSPDLRSEEDVAGIHQSRQHIDVLIRREELRGIATSHIMLAGFSQGGVMALHTGLRYPEKLAGIMALSCYLPLVASLDTEKTPANLTIPVFMAHGLDDPVVSLREANAARDILLNLGYPVEWHEYTMAHSVCAKEISDISQWLCRTLTREIKEG